MPARDSADCTFPTLAAPIGVASSGSIGTIIELDGTAYSIWNKAMGGSRRALAILGLPIVDSIDYPAAFLDDGVRLADDGVVEIRRVNGLREADDQLDVVAYFEDPRARGLLPFDTEEDVRRFVVALALPPIRFIATGLLGVIWVLGPPGAGKDFRCTATSTSSRKTASPTTTKGSCADSASSPTRTTSASRSSSSCRPCSPKPTGSKCRTRSHASRADAGRPVKDATTAPLCARRLHCRCGQIMYARDGRYVCRTKCTNWTDTGRTPCSYASLPIKETDSAAWDAVKSYLTADVIVASAHEDVDLSRYRETIASCEKLAADLES